jgi:simple sugar transport system substrate-binding protein
VKKLTALLLTLMLMFGVFTVGVQAEGDAKSQPLHIIYFVGGDAGDVFASIVYKGAMAAAELLKPVGVTVDYVFSGWQTEKMVSQFREAIAMKPQAICMMGHAGDDALMALADEAKQAGIIMMYQNVDVPTVRSEYGGGFVGLLDLGEQGKALANRSINEFGLKEGERALVFGSWGQPGRYAREEGVAQVFEENKMNVERIVSPPEASSDPQILLPIISAQLASYPETKIIVYPGSQQLSAVQTYMEACGKKPGEILNVGFDLTADILKAFDDGWVQLTADQQPFLQGFMPIMSTYLTYNYQLSASVWDTGAGIVDTNNYASVADLVKEGYR